MSNAKKLSSFSNNYRYTKALIYCRVSSERQVNEGHGLDSQEKRCIKRARELNLEVAEIFRDEGVSGRLFTRPAMIELISFLDSHKSERFIIIFDDLKRFSRDLEVHLKLKTELVSRRGAKLECLNFNFEDNPTGHFIEQVMVGAGQLEREQNTQQVFQKMTARLEAGYWSFAAKKGYDLVENESHVKIGMPNKEGLEMLKPALEEFANGTLTTKIDVVRALMAKGFWKTQRPEKYIDKIAAIMKDPYYAGMIEYVRPPNWNVSRRPGRHKPIISIETYELIQKRLGKNGLSKKVRIDTSPDFPLRGLIIHDKCGGHLTSAWYKGRHKKYRKYVCHTQGCPDYNKPFCAEDVEEKFETVLKNGRLKKEVDEILKMMFNRVWQDETANIKKQESDLDQQKRALEQKLSEFADLAADAKSPNIRLAYETRIENITKGIQDLEEKKVPEIDMTVPYQTALDKATLLLKKPDLAWNKFDVPEQHGLFFFLFLEKLPYSIKEGYQTAKIPYSTTLFEDFADETTHLVEMAGVKPASRKDHLKN